MGHGDSGPPDRGGPGSPAMDVDQARVLTEQLRDAVAEVRRTGMALADRIRAAHQGRVWTPLGYASWAEYATAELGVSRAQAYRLVEISATAGQLVDVAAGLELASPAGDIDLSGRALRDVHHRVEEVADRLAERVEAAHAAGRTLAGHDVAELIRQAVEDVRRRPPALAPHPAPATDKGDPVVTGRALLEELYADAAQLGEIALELAPAHLSEYQAATATRLPELADEIGISTDDLLAHRRYALTGDRRCLEGVL